MTSVQFIDNLIGMVMILVRLAVVCRCAFLLIRMSMSDEIDGIKKKLINTIVFYIMAEAVNQIPSLIEHYLK